MINGIDVAFVVVMIFTGLASLAFGAFIARRMISYGEHIQQVLNEVKDVDHPA